MWNDLKTTALFAALAVYLYCVCVRVCVWGLEYLQSLNLERVVMCQLNPLKLCLPAVTSMFAAITRYKPLSRCAAQALLSFLILMYCWIFHMEGSICRHFSLRKHWYHDLWRFSVGHSWAFFVLYRKYQIVFCYNVIERNKRHMLPVVRSSTGGDCVTIKTNPLDSFFPFDPYLLKRWTHSSLSYTFILTFTNTLKTWSVLQTMSANKLKYLLS